MANDQLATLILAAGQGTRMKSNRVKVLHGLNGEPMFSYPVRLALGLDASPIVLIVGHQGEEVEAAAASIFPDQVTCAYQTEQKGTGHAVMQGMKKLQDHKGRILILYGDVPLLEPATIKKMMKLMDKEKLAVTLITTEFEDPKGYGRIIRDDQGKMLRITEDKDCTPDEKKIREINAGIYCVESAFLSDALGRINNDNAQGEYYLTDIAGIAIEDGLTIGTVLADPDEVRGANTRKELAYLAAVNRERIADRLMASGVTIVDPTNTYIGDRVKIGRDTIIEPGVHLRGDTVIGKECHIDVGAVIMDAKLGDNVTVNPHTVIQEGVLKKEVSVGPFARIRPGAELMDGSKVGNFVEMKKARLGKGAKASHLAYLGDAKIGDGSNIGAGTITCNYDGFGKNLTDIGKNVFIGSNSTLVAPLKIANDAYVAAGSTITDAVGKADLALGRARQTNKKGRADAIRAAAKKQAEEAKAKKAKE